MGLFFSRGERGSCGECRFFHKGGRKYYDGQCRFNPPEILVEKDGDMPSVWPGVDHRNWCGKFERGENNYVGED